MTLTKKAVRKSAAHRAKATRRSFHRRPAASSPVVAEAGPVTVTVNRAALEEYRDWAIFAGVSAAGFAAAAIAFGVV